MSLSLDHTFWLIFQNETKNEIGEQRIIVGRASGGAPELSPGEVWDEAVKK